MIHRHDLFIAKVDIWNDIESGYNESFKDRWVDSSMMMIALHVKDEGEEEMCVMNE